MDAIALGRQQLFRAANGTVALPAASHWASGGDELNDNSEHDNHNGIISLAQQKTILLLWALDTGYWMGDTAATGSGAGDENAAH